MKFYIGRQEDLLADVEEERKSVGNLSNGGGNRSDEEDVRGIGGKEALASLASLAVGAQRHAQP